jgi:hypothetical protein
VGRLSIVVCCLLFDDKMVLMMGMFGVGRWFWKFELGGMWFYRANLK